MVCPLSALFALGMLTSAAGAALAQAPAGAGQPPPPLANLQIIAKDTPRQQVIQTMQAFAQGLGVRCEYCHVDEGPGKQDFASDAKRTKTVAREMMRLTSDINGKLPTVVGKTAADATRVQCATCHRGVAIPKQLTDILTQTMTTDSTTAAVAQYRDMRKQYYGGQSYDFSEASLVTLAQRLNAGGKPDDAMTWLQLNLEFFPRSVRAYQLLGMVYAAKKDTDNAVKALQKALEIDPENAQTKRQLDALKK